MLSVVIGTSCLYSQNAHVLKSRHLQGAYYSGEYTNLLRELLHKSDSEISSRIHATFNQLFFGDSLTERVYYPAGPDMAYIEDVNNKDVRTEGMSYGMMICVQMDKKPEFDRLWKWAKTHMQFREGSHKGYFAWHCTTDGRVIDSTAASDGEEWFVTSLFFASARWGDTQGIFDYHREAQAILNTMLRKDSEPGHGPVTSMFSATRKLVAFVPNRHGAGFTDPSYQLPHFYELWARWSNDDHEFWCDVAGESRALLAKAADSVTGLSPDYCTFDGKPLSPWPGGHDDFRFDAWRVAMNIGVDHEWFASDSNEVTLANRMLHFFERQGVTTYGNQYTLGGRKLSDDHSAGLVGMNAVAALASTNNYRTLFVEDFWNTPIPHGPYRYYDGMLYMLAMLQVSGHFIIYDPLGKPMPACSPK